MKRPVLAQLSAFGAAFVVIVAVTALWIVNLRLGPRIEGFTGGAMVLIVPIALLIVIVVWAVLRALSAGRAIGGVLAFVGGAILGLILVVGNCGPTACFLPGNERFAGWFVVVGGGLATLAHQMVLDRFSQETRDAHSS